MDTQSLQVLIISAAGRLCHSLQAIVASLPMVGAVCTATDEASAMQKLTTRTIDLMLLDGDLSHAVRRRLLRHLRQQPRAITTILFGGTAQAGRRALWGGVIAWLPTGFSTKQLALDIQNSCRTRQTKLTARATTSTVNPPYTNQTIVQTTGLIAPAVDQAAHTARVVVGKELRMAESTNSALVTALRDFFMARNRTELRLAYLDLAQATPQPAPRGIKWDELEFAFNRLFVGPKALFAPPYASVYLDPDPQLMGRTTVKMREFYQLLTLASPTRQLLPDDHLGLELDAYRQLQIAAAKVDSPELLLMLSYLCNHLRQWVPLFVTRVHCAEGTPPALLFVVDQLAQWLAAEELTNKSRSLSNKLAMIGVAV